MRYSRIQTYLQPQGSSLLYLIKRQRKPPHRRYNLIMLKEENQKVTVYTEIKMEKKYLDRRITIKTVQDFPTFHSGSEKKKDFRFVYTKRGRKRWIQWRRKGYP